MIVYDPRARYLTGLLGWPSYDPRRRYLTGYDPRQRYLYGYKRVRPAGSLGDDSIPQIPYIPTATIATGPDGTPFLISQDSQGNVTSTPIDPSGPSTRAPSSTQIYSAIPTRAELPAVAAQQAAASLMSGPVIAAGVLGVAAIALLGGSSGGGRRR